MNQHGFAGAGGLTEPIDGDVEVEEAAVFEMVEARAEKALRRIARDMSAGGQQPAGHFRQTKRLAQPVDYFGRGDLGNEPPRSRPG